MTKYKRRDRAFEAKLCEIADRKKPEEKLLKAAIHGFLAVLGAIELFNCSSRTRKFILGTAVGWHSHATFYHLFLEKPKEKL